ncbi:MAG: DUF975 family protein [Oscillospiraceae bacterium]|nr:DUF975 family protein [Oscillospiraceae bacterium]
MTAELIDRKQLKADARALLAEAEVSPKGMVALYLGLCLVLNLLVSFSGNAGLLGTFVNILTTLLGWVLGAGFVLYCMAVRRGERAEFLTLFDGFSFVGKIIGLNIVMSLFIFLWSMLFAVPGIIAAYRYRFALYNLYENPGIGVMEALNMSKRQTLGYKGQLFALDLSYLGWSLLASVPALVYAGAVYWNMLQSVLAYTGGPLLMDTAAYLGLPDWAWTLIIGLWSLAAALFYLANYQCVELGYFETAKRTSGVGEGAAPRQESPWGGPDNLGGF